MFALRFVEHVDGTRLGAGKLGRLADNRAQHCFQIKRRIDRPRHFAKCTQLGNRDAQTLLALGKRGGKKISRFSHVGDFVVSEIRMGAAVPSMDWRMLWLSFCKREMTERLM